jgi:hypothetical protein
MLVGLGMNLGDHSPGLVSAFSYHGYLGLGRIPTRSPESWTWCGPPSSRRGECSSPPDMRVGAAVNWRCHDTELTTVLDEALRARTRAARTWRSDARRLRASASSRPATQDSERGAYMTGALVTAPWVWTAVFSHKKFESYDLTSVTLKIREPILQLLFSSPCFNKNVHLSQAR